MAFQRHQGSKHTQSESNVDSGRKRTVLYVGVDDLNDRRSVFCCAKCERQYWREVTRHPTHLTNHDPGMYQWAEKVENERDSVENLVKDVEAYNRLAGRE